MMRRTARLVRWALNSGVESSVFFNVYPLLCDPERTLRQSKIYTDDLFLRRMQAWLTHTAS